MQPTPHTQIAPPTQQPHHEPQRPQVRVVLPPTVASPHSKRFFDIVKELWDNQGVDARRSSEELVDKKPADSTDSKLVDGACGDQVDGDVASEIVLECIYSVDINVCELAVRHKCLVLHSGQGRWLIGRQHQPRLFLRLMPKEVRLSCISRSCFELIWEDPAIMLRRVSQNSILLDGNVAPPQICVPVGQGSELGICGHDSAQPLLVFRLLLRGAETVAAEGAMPLPTKPDVFPNAGPALELSRPRPQRQYVLTVSQTFGTELAAVPLETRTFPLQEDASTFIGLQHQPGFFERFISAETAQRCQAHIADSHLELVSSGDQGQIEVVNHSASTVTLGTQTLSRQGDRCSIQLPTSIGFVSLDASCVTFLLVSLELVPFDSWPHRHGTESAGLCTESSTIGGSSELPASSGSSLESRGHSGLAPPLLEREARGAVHVYTDRPMSPPPALPSFGVERATSTRVPSFGWGVERPSTQVHAGVREPSPNRLNAPFSLERETTSTEMNSVQGSIKDPSWTNLSPRSSGQGDGPVPDVGEAPFWLDLNGEVVRDLPRDQLRVVGSSQGLSVGRVHQPQVHKAALSDDVVQFVSREHFHIQNDSGTFFLVPLSGNPMWRRRHGERIEAKKGEPPMLLEDGDEVVLFTGATDRTPDGAGSRGSLQWTFRRPIGPVPKDTVFWT